MFQWDIDNYWLDYCEVLAHKSYSRKLIVGAVIVKEGRMLSQGYRRHPDKCLPCEYLTLDNRLITYKEVISAEIDALNGCQSADGATMYITSPPDPDDVEAIIKSGIKQVVYRYKSQSDESVRLLKRHGIDVCYLPPIDINFNTRVIIFLCMLIFAYILIFGILHSGLFNS